MKKLCVLSIYSLLSLSSCIGELPNQKTSIHIEENERHYYPILYEQTIDLTYKIKNIGNAPLVITDIFTSCACLQVKDGTTKIIPQGKQGFVRLSYTANMNVGYAKHHISLYGNFKNKVSMELIFDIHIVPSQTYIKDYEDIVRVENLKNAAIKKLGDGDETNKGYYLDKLD